MNDYTLHVFPDAETLAREAALWVCERAQASGRFALSLSGGSTPKRLYELLATEPLLGKMPWARVHLFWGDERFVPFEDAESNFRMASGAMISHVPIPPENVHPMPVDGTPAQAATAYERTLKAFYGAETFDTARPLFDVTLLGLGEDGHTASLFPGTAVLGERAAWVASVVGAKPEPRITLTYPALDSSAAVAFLIAGAGKRAMLARLRAGDVALPSARVAGHGQMHIFADEAALDD